MISIFQGRKLSLDGTADEIYATVAVSLRDKLHLFNTGKSLNSFAVFMCIALHTDRDGWAYPSRGLLQKETGFATSEAIGHALKHLRSIKLEGYRFLKMYRQYDPDLKRWGRTVYRIFPDAFKDDTTSAPFPNLVEWNPRPNRGKPGTDQPRVDQPQVDSPEVEQGGDMKDLHSLDHHLLDPHAKLSSPEKKAACAAATTPSLSDTLSPIPGSGSGSSNKKPPRSLPRTKIEGHVKASPLGDSIYRPGVTAFKESGGAEIVHIQTDRMDMRITCPLCETEQDWPPAEGRRKKAEALTCWECGALFVVHGYKVKGQDKKYTYTHPEIKFRGPGWRLEIEGVPFSVQMLPCTEAEMLLFIRNWDESDGLMRAMLEWVSHQDWASDDVLVARVNAAFETTRRNQVAAEAELVVAEPEQDPRVGPDEIWFGPDEPPPEREDDSSDDDPIPF